jgi:hypothetical protein
MLTRQVSHFVAEFELLYANGTLNGAFISQQLLVHLLPRELTKGCFRGRRCGVGLWIRLHEGRDDAIKSLLRVDGIAGSEIALVEEAEEQGQGRHATVVAIAVSRPARGSLWCWASGASRGSRNRHISKQIPKYPALLVSMCTARSRNNGNSSAGWDTGKERAGVRSESHSFSTSGCAISRPSTTQRCRERHRGDARAVRRVRSPFYAWRVEHVGHFCMSRHVPKPQPREQLREAAKGCIISVQAGPSGAVAVVVMVRRVTA